MTDLHRNSNDSEAAYVQDDSVEDMTDGVRYANSVVPLTDNPQTPSLTVRAVAIGAVLALFHAFVSALFSFRTVPITIPGGFSIIFAYPIGMFLSKILPKKTILNPGPFSIKEHIIVYVIANSANGQPYGLDNVVGQYHFLKDKAATFWPSLIFIITTQFIGYGLSGLTRRFLVRPPAMFWPVNLPYIALFRTFHETVNEHERTKSVGTLSRWNMFWIVFVVIFIWEWFPQYLASVLQCVAVLCLLSRSKLASWLGSANTGGGYGMLSLSFDWAVLAPQGVLYRPFYVTFVGVCGYIFFYWVFGPILEATNPFGHPFMPSAKPPLRFHDNSSFPAINTNIMYSRNGTVISPRTLLTDTFTLDQAFYDANNPIHISNPFATLYFTSFFIISAALTHVMLWYGKDIWRQTKEALRQAQHDEGDVHAKLMRSYPDVPDWVYLSFTVIMLTIQIFVFQYTSYRLEWWATIFAFGLGLIYIIPIGIIQALTGLQLGLNVITEFVIGLIIPGKFIDVITFKSFGYNIMIQALALTADLKLGHYMHINPIHMIAAQFLGTLIGAIIETMTAFYVMDNLQTLLESGSVWSTVNYNTFVNAGLLWGAIGPARFFGPGSPYFGILLGFPIGFLAPFLPWLANKVWPSKYWHYINFAIFGHIGNPAQNNSWFLVGLLIAYIFQYHIFRYHYAWWSKYNFVIATALDTGMNIAVMCITFLTASNLKAPSSFLNPDSCDSYCFME